LHETTQLAWDISGLVLSTEAEILDLSLVRLAQLVDLLAGNGICSSNRVGDALQAVEVDEIFIWMSGRAGRDDGAWTSGMSDDGGVGKDWSLPLCADEDMRTDAGEGGVCGGETGDVGIRATIRRRRVVSKRIEDGDVDGGAGSDDDDDEEEGLSGRGLSRRFPVTRALALWEPKNRGRSDATPLGTSTIHHHARRVRRRVRLVRDC
ncbi:hypothetical protein KCU85_g76, partial [Aureobasidium melanogenum]